MNVNKISSLDLTNKNGLKLAKTAYNPSLYANSFDSVSFSGKGKKVKKAKKDNKAKKNTGSYSLGTRIKAGTAAGMMLLTSIIPGCSGLLNRKNDDADNTAPSTGIYEQGEMPDYSAMIDRVFQEGQTNDAPSLTFDFTDNYKARIIKPDSSIVQMKNETETLAQYSNLSDIMTYVYNIEEDDYQERQLAVYSILKSNPWMADVVLDENKDSYGEGDVTNIPYEVIMDTKFIKDDSTKSIHLPDVTVFEEMRNDHDTVFVGSTTFSPSTELEEGHAISLEFDSEQLKNAKDAEGIIAIVDKALAETYGIQTMNSKAGIAIWHGISLYEPNEEIFKNSSENDNQQALVKYVINNGYNLDLTLPNVPVSVMAEETTNRLDSSIGNDDINELLQQELPSDYNKAIISYVAHEEPVVDMADYKENEITFINVLSMYKFTDGTTLKEAYEKNPDKYESLALSAVRQTIDNNNALLAVYKDRSITAMDLYEPIDFSKAPEKELRVNLQPLAFVEKQECDPDSIVYLEKEVIKEVPGETVYVPGETKYVKVPYEVVKEVIKEVPGKTEYVEVPVEVVKEIIKEVPVEVVKEVIKEVPVEVVKEIIKEVPVEVIKEVPVEKIVYRTRTVYVDRPVYIEVPGETVYVEKEVIKEVPVYIYIDKDDPDCPPLPEVGDGSENGEKDPEAGDGGINIGGEDNKPEDDCPLVGPNEGPKDDDDTDASDGGIDFGGEEGGSTNPPAGGDCTDLPEVDTDDDNSNAGDGGVGFKATTSETIKVDEVPVGDVSEYSEVEVEYVPSEAPVANNVPVNSTNTNNPSNSGGSTNSQTTQTVTSSATTSKDDTSEGEVSEGQKTTGGAGPDPEAEDGGLDFAAADTEKAVVKEAPVEEVVIEEAQVEKAVVEEAPVEEVIIEEAPVEEVVQEAPAQVTEAVDAQDGGLDFSSMLDDSMLE